MQSQSQSHPHQQPLGLDYAGSPFTLGGALYPTLLTFMVCRHRELVTGTAPSVPTSSRATRLMYRKTPRPDQEQHAVWKATRGRLLTAAVLAQAKYNTDLLRHLLLQHPRDQVIEIAVAPDDPESKYYGGTNQALSTTWTALRDRLCRRSSRPAAAAAAAADAAPSEPEPEPEAKPEPEPEATPEPEPAPVDASE